jgi:hypothetical protein
MYGAHPVFDTPGSGPSILQEMPRLCSGSARALRAMREQEKDQGDAGASISRDNAKSEDTWYRIRMCSSKGRGMKVYILLQFITQPEVVGAFSSLEVAEQHRKFLIRKQQETEPSVAAFIEKEFSLHTIELDRRTL